MKYKYLPELDPIQWEIVKRLNSFGKKRFSDLKPENIENDLFNYHLKFLVTKGLVEKDTNGYELSIEGRKLVQNIDVNGRVYNQFKFSVILYVLKGEGKNMQILTHKNNRYPFINDISTIAGKVKQGEKVEDATKRKLMEESVLIGDFKVIGILRKIRRSKENKEVLEDTIYNVCICNKAVGELIEKNDFGENKWVLFGKYKTVVKNNIDLGDYDLEVINRIEKRNEDFFYFQQDMVVESY